MVNVLVAAAALAAASPTVTPAAANADPAIFMVRDADTTVYIFGTFHALDGQAEWFNDQVKDAFEKSNELVLETLVPEDARPNRAASAGSHAERDAPPPPSSQPRAWRSTPARRRACRSTTAPTWCFATRRKLEGKPVEGLETLELQLNMFTSMPATAAAPRAEAGTAGRRGTRWRACRRRWPTCSRRGNAATRACSCGCSAS